ncbi:CvpA family protein [Phenylobacterium sp.]|jgi:membrane protein required for colicin V production|uniref:CvpA family protein n=1 Tax=Phenylobacterium sp. TaxID=1871053 RepID=UPI002E32A7A2|nr:CvpA family protein [Phenylobacterium sp.]HEX2558713.1 CvpA family protein [Phenylobacterium sp.]
MTLFDVIALAVLAVSAIVGFARGGVREMINVVSLIVSALVAVFGLRVSGPILRGMMDPDWTGNVAAVVIVFVGAYIALRVGGAFLARRLHATQALGALDRAVGTGFGLLRALVVLGAFALVFNAATPPERVPQWISGAALYPLTAAAGEVLKAFAPKGLDMAGQLKPALEDAVRDGSRDPADGGYDAKARKGLEDVLEKTR